MSFRLWTVFYVFALFASAMATFGPWGIFAACLVLAIRAWIFYGLKRRPTVFEVLVTVIILGFLVLLFPAVQSAREASSRTTCINNLKQISLALIVYESMHKTFPAAHPTNGNGSIQHSWRVEILPYLEATSLYNRYNFNEPWNGPNNSKIIDNDWPPYRCLGHSSQHFGEESETNYFVVVGAEAVFNESASRSLRTIKDGASKTILAIEASGLEVKWKEPRDLSIDEAVELLATKPHSGHMHVNDGFLSTTYYVHSARCVAFCDGHIEFMKQLKDPSVARALLTCAGGEPIPQELPEKLDEPKITTVIKWGRVWALTVFVTLSLLPSKWLLQQQAQTTPAEETK
jgi:hypothetical protein